MLRQATAPLMVQFSDESTGSPTGWQWSWGDLAANDTIPNPVHVFDTPGLYTVTLTTTNPGGSNTTQKINYINVTAAPTPTPTPTPVADPCSDPDSDSNADSCSHSDSEDVGYAEDHPDAEANEKAHALANAGRDADHPAGTVAADQPELGHGYATATASNRPDTGADAGAAAVAGAFAHAVAGSRPCAGCHGFRRVQHDINSFIRWRQPPVFPQIARQTQRRKAGMRPVCLVPLTCRHR